MRGQLLLVIVIQLTACFVPKDAKDVPHQTTETSFLEIAKCEVQVENAGTQHENLASVIADLECMSPCTFRNRVITAMRHEDIGKLVKDFF